eukprot:TRINITY_DN1622_c0_g1_i3.p1 TRINITY_DN1622_c0_g1~~TRINITY_DN1622_c0_g1_i3.p1  ORF type:complete len:413 (+),score=62.59 TRINITY_DN1622_c0_g1_i3:306-1544(+)
MTSVCVSLSGSIRMCTYVVVFVVLLHGQLICATQQQPEQQQHQQQEQQQEQQQQQQQRYGQPQHFPSDNLHWSPGHPLNTAHDTSRPSVVRKHGIPDSFMFHFTHVPKAGGTTIKSMMQEYMGCPPAGRNCVPKGDPCFNRVLPCRGHEPRLDLFDSSPRPDVVHVINLREPRARALSGFYFDDPHATFEEYISNLKHQNIATKMLNNIEPREDVVVDQSMFDQAVAMLHRFDVVMILEYLDASFKDLARVLPFKPFQVPMRWSRNKTGTYPGPHSESENIWKTFDRFNAYDHALYREGLGIFCANVMQHEALHKGDEVAWKALGAACQTVDPVVVRAQSSITLTTTETTNTATTTTSEDRASKVVLAHGRDHKEDLQFARRVKVMELMVEAEEDEHLQDMIEIDALTSDRN